MEKYFEFAADHNSAIRIHSESEHTYRSKFERDRDRVLYSKGFRRLSGKTQVFVTSFDDHTRTRLTHTIEVAQIAQTISKQLGLDESLTEAIAVAHDIGHTPFGHVGERSLNFIMNGCDEIKDFNNSKHLGKRGFKHNWQGLRVITHLEKISREYDGLNLTDYTAWGILHHSKIKWGKCKNNINSICSLRHSGKACTQEENMLSLDFYDQYNASLFDNSWTLEGLVVRMADEIAQRHHDIEDALEARIMNKDELIDQLREIFRHFLTKDDKHALEMLSKEKEQAYYLSGLSKFIVNYLTSRLINDTCDKLKKIKADYQIESNTDFLQAKSKIKSDFDNSKESIYTIVSYDFGFAKSEEKLQEYLGNRILNSYLAQSMDGKAIFILRNLIKAYLSNPQQLPDTTVLTLYKNLLSSSEWDRYRTKPVTEIVGQLRNQLRDDHFQKNDYQYRNLLLRTICDFIAGMTDQFALDQYEILYGEKMVGK